MVKRFLTLGFPIYPFMDCALVLCHREPIIISDHEGFITEFFLKFNSFVRKSRFHRVNFACGLKFN